MLGDLFSGWHIWIILLIIVLLFGATRLPALARSIGQSTRIFKKEIREGQEEDEAAATAKGSKDEAKAEPAAADKPADKI
ncbi:twin-arginine translocase TatA/TatE family subunit [Rathayibacter sp. KR2-224]|uniref:twin-arginine translocase TatA/TatE family subunit n=1 Tax=Rathayibacter sp. KR2-224 TaxID=3400913 RepID=UPI003C0E321C